MVELVRGERGSGGYLANMLGENPGTQGREFVSCQGGVANPGFGVAGGFMPKVKNFFIMPFTGRKDPVPSSTTPFAGQWLSLVPGALASGSQPPPPPPGDGGGGGTVVAGDAGGNGPSFSDGCSMAPGANTTSGGAVMLLLAGAWLFLRRRSLQPERAKSRRSS